MAITSLTITVDVSGQIAVGTSGSTGYVKVGSAISSTALANGTGASQANLVYMPSNVLVSTGSPLDIDLRGGTTLLSPDGLTISFTKITSITIVHRGTTGTMTIGGGTNPLFPSGLPAIGAGGKFHVEDTVNGIAITGGSNDLLRISTSVASVPVDITISGQA